MTQEQLDKLHVGAIVFVPKRYSRHGVYDALEVVGETSRSWLVGESWRQSKLPKRIPKGQTRIHGYFASQEDIEKNKWVDTNAWPIGDWVRRCSDYETLQRIAAMVGYEERK